MTEIEKNFVSSSNVEAIGYNADTQTLRIWFLNGTIYDYYNVPFVEYEGLRSASSVGTYLHRNIKGAYPYQKVG